MTSRSVKQKQLSSEALWERIEEIYGVVPELIKKILQINGFDSYLALKGIRYDDKNDFFNSLEDTVREVITSSEESEEKMELEKIIRGYCDLKNFKLKPGHRNLIMNLMIEIDSSDANEFFKISQEISPKKMPDEPVEVKFQIDSLVSHEQQIEDNYAYQIHEYIQEQQPEEIIEKYEEPSIVDEEYLLEEYLSEENKSVESNEMEGYVLEFEQPKKRTVKRVHRRPERMYNEEFLSSHSNPRKRRVTSTKFYPYTDEGTRERFQDSCLQSMQCILSTEQLNAYENVSIEIQKVNDGCWTISCPICHSTIKLAVVLENNGRYINYKRSNFERHLRYKHCKTHNKKGTKIN